MIHSESQAIRKSIDIELTGIRQELDHFSQWVESYDHDLDTAGIDELLNIQDTLNQFCEELDAIKGDDFAFLSTAKNWKYKLLGYYAIYKTRIWLWWFKLGKSEQEKTLAETIYTIYNIQDIVDGENEYMLWVQRDIGYIHTLEYLKSLLEDYRTQREQLMQLRERYCGSAVLGKALTEF